MGQNEWYIFGRMITHQQRHEARARFIVWMEPPWPCLILCRQHKYSPHSTQTYSRFIVFVGTGFFPIFRKKRMSRRPPEDRGAVVFLHNEGLTTAEICRRTGFERRFVRRWISRY